MCKRYWLLCFSLLVLFNLAAVVSASPAVPATPAPPAVPASTEEDGSATYYQDDKGRGYYWYQKYHQNKEEDKKPQTFTYEQLWNMHPDDFKTTFENITKQAVQNPTIENVERYLMGQDVARRKSLAFASVVNMVGQQNPQYGETDVYPVTGPGRKALTDMKEKEYDQVIRGERESFALILFEKEDCGFCTAQKSILKYFEENYEWSIRGVDVQQQQEFAAQFGVDITPTLLLVSKETQKHLIVSSGVISMDDLKKKLFRSIRYMKGEITPEQWAMFEFEKDSGHDPMKFKGK